MIVDSLLVREYSGMKRRVLFVLAVIILVGGLFAGGCGPSQPAPTSIAITATPNTVSTYLEILDAAQAAYEKSNFDEALTLAQKAAVLIPDRPTAWNLLEEISVARAGDEYLNKLPPSRYRIDTLNFLTNQVNGTQYFIVDVREVDEYAAGHIDGAVNIPLSELLDNLARLPESKTMPILLYCHTQKRATHALVILRELGYTNVFNLEGGWAAYEEWINNNPMPTPGPTPIPTEEPPSC
jgi:rhodanese-related sulfurtransferase